MNKLYLKVNKWRNMFSLMAKSAVAFILLTTAGCTLVPGSHISNEGVLGSSERYAAELQSVNIATINSKLIAEMRERNRQSRALANRGSGPELNHYEYRIGIGDVLSISVWDHPELTIPVAVQRTPDFDGFRVQPDGTITFAYAPKVPAEGRTIAELRQALTSRLDRVIASPQVDIKVVGFNSQKVYVTGEVVQPGVYPISDLPLTLIDALNQAGGLTDVADWQQVNLSRGESTELIAVRDFYIKGDLSQNRLLKHGDVIHVNRTDRQKVFVLGDVTDAGSIAINRYGVTLAEALSEAGGLKESTANANGVFVLRKRDYSTDGALADVYQLHAKNAVALVLAEQFELQPRDIVYVTTAPVARWNRLINQLLPSLILLEGTADIKDDLQ